MCRFFSGIMKYKMAGIWWDMDLDSHTDILEKFKINDEKRQPAFVKFEMTPKDDDVFNHVRENWVLAVDSDHSQDSIPEWWDRKRAEDIAWIHLHTVFEERFLIGVTDERTIEMGRWWVKDSKFNMSGGTLNDMSGGTLNNMSGGTLVKQNGGIAVRGNKITVANKSYTLEYV